MKNHGIKSVRILRENGNTDKLVFEFSSMRRVGKLKIDGEVYSDCFNDCEPYDRKAHIFRIPSDVTDSGKTAVLSSALYFMPFIRIRSKICPGSLQPCTEEEINDLEDNRLAKKTEETQQPAEGLSYTHSVYENRNGAPVHVFTLSADMKAARIYLGTPGDGYKSRRVKATIPEMIAAAEKNGKDVLASVNGDFFDIFGDMHPSGPAVKNGRIIANADSKRPFIGVTKDGKAVVTDLTEAPDILPELDCACAGLQRILKNGRVFDTAPAESFGYTPHPRTAAGIKADGSVVLTVIDGRIPDYSNGASLLDTARLMLASGCTDAINIDGGGSSAVYIKKDGRHELKSVPADLYKPNDKLIRKEANCITVIKNEH